MSALALAPCWAFFFSCFRDACRTSDEIRALRRRAKRLFESLSGELKQPSGVGATGRRSFERRRQLDLEKREPRMLRTHGVISLITCYPREELSPLFFERPLIFNIWRVEHEVCEPLPDLAASVIEFLVVHRVLFRPTSKMSHDGSWRDACASTRRDRSRRWL